MSTENLKSERHFFLEENRKTIYCVEYLPAEDHDKHSAVILCKPIWGERMRTHIIFTNLARLLASEGFTVITCDYFGDGNSGGDTLDLTFTGMVDDINVLYHYISKKYQPRSFALIGLRVGANCAISVHNDVELLSKIILIEPILSLIDFLKIALRSNLTNQLVVYKKIVKNRDKLIQEIINGTPVSFDGFLVGKQLWESFEFTSPLQVNSNFKGLVNILSMADKGKKGSDFSNLAGSFSNGKYETIEKEFSWSDNRYYVPTPPILFNKIMNELTSELNI